MARFCEPKQLDLVEAIEFIEDPYKATCLHPFRDGVESGHGRKRKRETIGKGTVTPRHTSSAEKYGTNCLPKKVKDLISSLCSRNSLFSSNKETKKSFIDFVSLSLAKNTWKRYGSALSLFEKFRTANKIQDFSWNNAIKIQFLCWTGKNSNLKSQTISMYFSAIDKLYNLVKSEEGAGCVSMQKIILKGIKNKDSKEKSKNRSAKKYTPLTLHTLQKVRQYLKNKNFPNETTQSLWTACIVGFWGCFRLREITCKKKQIFDKYSDLIWENVTFGKKCVKILLQSPKTGTPLTVVLGKLHRKMFCPVQNLKKLLKLQKKSGSFSTHLPIFRKGSGNNIRPQDLVHCLNKVSVKGELFQGKSFRAGIPNLLTKEPEIFTCSDVKISGRWKSHAYQSYLHEKNLDLALYKKIATHLLTKIS